MAPGPFRVHTAIQMKQPQDWYNHPRYYDAVFDSDTSMEADFMETIARRHLELVARSLLPGGLYALGLHLTDYQRQRPCHERWVGRSRGLEVVCNTRTWPADRRRRLEPMRSRLRITEVTTAEATPRCHQIETNWQFRTYDAGQLRRLLRSVPEFDLVAVHDFHYAPDRTTTIDGGQHDLILILCRREQ